MSERDDKATGTRERDQEREQAKQRQRDQQERQHKRQEEAGIQPSPPPYEVPETTLERLGPGFAYLLGIIAGGFLLNLIILWVIAASNGG